MFGNLFSDNQVRQMSEVGRPGFEIGNGRFRLQPAVYPQLYATNYC